VTIYLHVAPSTCPCKGFAWLDKPRTTNLRHSTQTRFCHFFCCFRVSLGKILRLPVGKVTFAWYSTQLCHWCHLSVTVTPANRQLCHWSDAFKHEHPQVLLIESHVTIGTIQQTQDAASVFWAYRLNSWHAAWPTVILRFMETRWKTLALSPRKFNKTNFCE